MATIKPFARPGFTMFNNYILDHIMPDLSASGWKVLCVAIRQTIGWQDEEAESGRRETEVISYSQFRQMTGIGSDQTVARAIKECVDKGYMLRIPGEGQEISYGLNMEYEIEVDTNSLRQTTVRSPSNHQDSATETVEAESESTSTKTVEVVNEEASTKTVEVGEDTSTETVEVASDTPTEIVEDTSTKSVETKENINKAPTAKEKIVPPLLEKNIWQAALGELQWQMTKATFDTWVRDTRLVSCQDDVFVIGAPNEFVRGWLEDRLLTTIERVLVGIVGHPVQVRFVKHEA